MPPMTQAALAALRKICASCGREITWRKKWELCWDSIIYCSATCRRPLGALDKAFEVGILDLLRTRRGIDIAGHKKGGASTSFCTCEEAEAMVLEAWKNNPLAEREVDMGPLEDDRSDDDEGRGEEAHVVEVEMNRKERRNLKKVEASPPPTSRSDEGEDKIDSAGGGKLNRKERRKADAAAALAEGLISSSPESNGSPSLSSTPPKKPSYIPTFPKLDSLSLSDSPSTPSGSSPVSSPVQIRSAPRDTRERCRKAARRLVIVNAIEIWQKGKVVDPSFAKGVMELRGGVNFDLIARGRETEGTGSWEKEDNWEGRGKLYDSGKLGKKRKGNQKNGRANE